MNPAVVLSALAILAVSVTAPAVGQSKPETSAAPEPSAEGEAAAPASAVSPELIARGEKVFQGPGNCYACHGSKGEGSVGPNLTDAEWIHSKGSLEDITAQITNGVPKEKAKSGIPMPAKGGGTLSDEDVRAVAAYVYSLSHK
ncbi:MAG TPA: c-type cytochrome [Gemmatimonadales bacterium]|nr:c-type cytochrome [Gemmatimonadales bacterium]